MFVAQGSFQRTLLTEEVGRYSLLQVLRPEESTKELACVHQRPSTLPLPWLLRTEERIEPRCEGSALLSLPRSFTRLQDLSGRIHVATCGLERQARLCHRETHLGERLQACRADVRAHHYRNARPTKRGRPNLMFTAAVHSSIQIIQRGGPLPFRQRDGRAFQSASDTSLRRPPREATTR